MIGDLVRDDVYAVDKRDPVRRIQGTIRGDRDDIPVLVDDGKPFGVLNERGMIQSRIDPDEKLDDYAVGTRLVTPSSSLDEVIRVLLTSGIRWVPAVDGEELVGVVTADDAFAELVRQGSARDASAWDLMREGPLLEGEATLGEAIRVFREEAGTLHVLPVADERGRVDGALHRRTVIRAQEKGERSDQRNLNPEHGGERDSRSDLPVEGLSDAHYQALGPDDGIQQVADAVEDFGFVFVAEDRIPKGTVTALTALRELKG